VIAEVEKHASAHDYHCTPAERRDVVAKVLEARVVHWLGVYQSDHARRRTPDDPISPVGGRTSWRQPAAPVAAEKGMAHEKTVGEKLEEVAARENISHEEQAERIGISRSAYFAVKAGGGGTRVRQRAALYLQRFFPNT